MEKINGWREFRKPLAYLPGILLLSLGIYVIIDQPQITYIRRQIQQESELREGTYNYKLWSDLNIFFRVWIFHVTNPNEVVEGENPILKEVGPFVYDLNIKRHVISIDEDLDELKFTTTKHYRFNAEQSGNLTEDTEVTVVSFAYIGVLRTIGTMLPSFIPKIGPLLHTLFPGTNGMFVKAKVGDILFRGLKLSCVNVDKGLNLICNFLNGKPPPLLQKTDTQGVFLYSSFQRVNGSHEGPFTVNRGIKNKDSLGNTTSFKNMRRTNFWQSDHCNIVRGTDSILWPPKPTGNRVNEFWVFEPNICRSIKITYTHDVIINTLMGNLAVLDHDAWESETMECPCDPKETKKSPVECLPIGLIDLTKCQEVPVIFSEPHFWNGPMELFNYAQPLEPSESKHATFIVVEPLTGAPLSGSKKIQLNVRVTETPTVPILANVTSGIFPILWAEEASVATVEQLGPVINGHRLLNVSKFLGWQLLLIGSWLIMKCLLINNQSYYQITYPRYPRREDAFE